MMEQTTFQVYKSKAMKSLLSPPLVTSTPYSHQVSKRIKCLLSYSEHYKGNRVDSPNVGPTFSPLRTRDYRKARELTLEIWDPMIQASFLERFLKSQRNLQTIRIRVLTEKGYKGKIWERLCQILGKMSGLTRIQIDFGNAQRHQVKLDVAKGMRSLRLVPRLKDLDVTVAGKQFLPFSVSLKKVGFDGEDPHLATPPLIEKLILKTSKFYQLDTIKIDCMYPRWFVDSLVLLISKLPNFRELDFNSSKGFNFPLEQAIKILDALAKAPKFEILGFGFPLPGKSQISLLEHPLFKAKSLRRASLALFFTHNELASFEEIKKIFDLLEGVSNLYELALNFDMYFRVNDEFSENHMEKISRVTSLRKLKMRFNSQTGLSQKQGRSIFGAIFNEMHFLEELDLQFVQDLLGLDLHYSQGLPSLKKASFHFRRSSSKEKNDIFKVMEIVGKCHQLRELELKLSNNSYDYEELTMKVSQSLRTLEKLQVFKYDANSAAKISHLTMDAVEDLVMTCDQLRNFQDLRMSLAPYNATQEARLRFQNLQRKLSANKKYRFVL